MVLWSLNKTQCFCILQRLSKKALMRRSYDVVVPGKHAAGLNSFTAKANKQ